MSFPGRRSDITNATRARRFARTRRASPRVPGSSHWQELRSQAARPAYTRRKWIFEYMLYFLGDQYGSDDPALHNEDSVYVEVNKYLRDINGNAALNLGVLFSAEVAVVEDTSIRASEIVEMLEELLLTTAFLATRDGCGLRLEHRFLVEKLGDEVPYYTADNTADIDLALHHEAYYVTDVGGEPALAGEPLCRQCHWYHWPHSSCGPEDTDADMEMFGSETVLFTTVNNHLQIAVDSYGAAMIYAQQ